MTRTSATDASRDNDISDALAEHDTLPCVLSFNASDPTGACGSSSDALVIGSIGAHALPVVTGVYVRDTRETLGHTVIDDTTVAEQAHAVAEDIPILTIKVGFLGSAEVVAAVAAFASDYASVPLIAYMPDLSWWSEQEIDDYLDAFRELLLPQTAVLVGNNATLRHWLLPESTTDRHARAADLARAAAEYGVSYVVVTGVPMAGDQLGNVLASPQAELHSQSFERIDAGFLGAGDILSAALAALLATGSDLTEAVGEALLYLDQALDHGFRPGMGRAVADRLFWASAEADDDGADDAASPDPLIDIPHPFNETKH
ncbi:MAG: bifunctional hydroxymethylpyrimidine kinase/phosphomethylpyrimidine kinase [Ottowia sp.]|jgi:hydroxymethylpyrimidine/phosphomethylpyrimidine kinase|uniref:Bifunctional hydroxymethylpyrimidine kinase/phosphomethylpyrimidine kinase n=1 Tax=Ottowia beijingensis TaxID=1207057 RepID=A0A853IV81_9BURK|nr:bifunctional hydroxymethylpyrimidine kinase/phosphomethylpyrimidine kinase [Ottowia beijingensis]MBP6778933.1 bifunctional hydroxymethylpyrimidine kinase/phosphomethylpyrimidine kinase [Ottowia sp.]MBP7535744.1 bifunctional hydroxymethylpyrimidine kinase/phosphomethylpyrimidine kinase [Ottowia sp.]NZA01367.1 bifunctional hydroxymethylpyrimidine kinase/phosphomethylpyrimidine kinase [Ottowia beijingensis]HRL35522.1 bifunctional hydroxymethylpyrimidine kinase/phosphomethylpyrimidine kinase [Ot